MQALFFNAFGKVYLYQPRVGRFTPANTCPPCPNNNCRVWVYSYLYAGTIQFMDQKQPNNYIISPKFTYIFTDLTKCILYTDPSSYLTREHFPKTQQLSLDLLQLRNTVPLPRSVVMALQVLETVQLPDQQHNIRLLALLKTRNKNTVY